MKSFIVIAVFLSFRLFSQINPPDLRCLEVLPNGDVQLTWIPPADPSNVFNSYQIFSSISPGGPFISVGTMGALAFTTFTDVGAGANIQSKYYFVKTNFGPGGASITVGSDTLRSIHLNVTQSSPALAIQYNNLHQPKLNSSASTFTISKEFPLGIWNNLGTTSNLTYADTISVCSASLNYQVALQDVSGCVSLSNIQGGIFNDSKVPDQLVVDSISVLPNGNTVLVWEIPRAMNIAKYRIYENINGIYPAIDSVIGRNNNIYTFTTTAANFSAVALYVAAIDSCDKIGGFDINPITMCVLAVYNTCDYSTQLSWNPYSAEIMPGGILEYRIYYSVNGGVFTRVGSTTQTSFVHNNVAPGQNICYFVRVVNKAQTITASSNQYCFFSSQALAPAYVYIKSASIIDKNKAEIDMYLDLSKTSTGIDLTRSEDGVNYTSIAFLPFNGSAMYSYIDKNINSQTTSYYYQAIVHDSCNNPRTKSVPHKTVLLKVNDDKEVIFNKHLVWTNYQGFAGGIEGYNIYRVINGVQNNMPSGQTGPSDTTYTDDVESEAPNGCEIEYVVQAVEGLGNPYGFQETSFSNKEEIYMEGRLFIPNAFAPHGRNKIWLPITYFVDKSDYNLRVFDKWGNKLFETTDYTEGWDGKDAIADVYVYLITYKNCRGEYIQEKGTFTFL